MKSMMSGVEDRNVQIWDSYYSSLQDSYLFPNEYAVRTFLGTYPRLRIDKNYGGKRICDISCGDGRNMTLFHKLGFILYGTELTSNICKITTDKLRSSAEINAEIRPGSNTSLPFPDGFFDYMLSWNACYYMHDENSSISDHISEYARIAKTGAYLVVSVPAPGCFSLLGAEQIGGDLIRIKTASKWGILNGSIYHQFRSFEDIETKFGTHFCNFQKCIIKDDCYGLPLEYFIFVCQKL